MHRALANSEWKAATVLAGSAAGFITVGPLKQRQQPEITNAITALIAEWGLKIKPDSSLDRWNLYEFIQVAENLGVIKPNTAKQTRLAKDFREISFTPASLSASAKNVTVPQPFLRSLVWSTLSETSHSINKLFPNNVVKNADYSPGIEHNVSGQHMTLLRITDRACEIVDHPNSG